MPSRRRRLLPAEVVMGAAWSCPRLWDGETCYLLGGGPSLRDLDPRLLAGRRTIAVNNPPAGTSPDILFFADRRWWRWYGERFADFAGRLVTLRTSPHPRVHALRKTGTAGIEPNPDGLRCRDTGLHAALNLALHLGVRRAILLGVDFRHTDDATHHHDGHPIPASPDRFLRMAEDLATTVQPLRALGLAVLNATPGSRLELWPRISLEEAFG